MTTQKKLDQLVQTASIDKQALVYTKFTFILGCHREVRVQDSEEVEPVQIRRGASTVGQEIAFT